MLFLRSYYAISSTVCTISHESNDVAYSYLIDESTRSNKLRLWWY